MIISPQKFLLCIGIKNVVGVGLIFLVNAVQIHNRIGVYLHNLPPAGFKNVMLCFCCLDLKLYRILHLRGAETSRVECVGKRHLASVSHY
jgi:hypothetical protein